jgi:16S rRNA processing protein RimM
MLFKNCRIAGRILKAHGTRGDLVLRFDNIDTEKIEPGESLFVEINGTLIPFYILEITPRGNTAVIKLEFVDDQAEAQKYTGRNIYLRNDLYKKINIPDLYNPNKFIGYSLSDSSSGLTGVISDYIENKANPLFLIKTPENQFLIPAHPEIIISIDSENKKIIANLPEGLTEL